MNTQDERARILEAASCRFLELGISKVTLDEIAADLRMSKKTLYKHFPSKEDLLKHILRARIQRNGSRVLEITGSGKPFEEKLRDLLTFVGREVSSPGKQFIIDLRKLAPGLYAEALHYRSTLLVTTVTRMMEEAKEQGVIREDVDTALFVLVFLSAVQNILTPQTLAEQSFSAVQAFRGILRILFEGAVTDESRGRLALADTSTIEFQNER